MDRKEFIGRDSFREFESHFRALGIDSVFLVMGKRSYAESGAAAMVDRMLEGNRSLRFSGVASNPVLNDVVVGTSLLRRQPADVVLAVGGGSVIDAAKCVSLLSQHDVSASGIVTGQLPIVNRATPIIAIPTTAGTGSEATQFASIYIGKAKFSLEHESILPAVAVVDPVFTMSLPPYQTAVTGIDALSQAIESFWSTGSTPESQEFAAKAIDLVMNNLRTAVNEPNEESRLSMIIAANLAGKAINISKTTACHALSYYLTSHFGLAHGHAVGLTLARMMLYNGDVSDEDVNDTRGAAFVREMILKLAKLLGNNEISEAAMSIEHLMCDIGLGGPVSDLNIEDYHIQEMVHEALNSNRMANNPRRFTAESLESLLSSVLI